MKSLVTLILALALSGCGPKPDTFMSTQPQVMGSGRISVNRIGVFEDNLAYDDKRGIYVIIDNKTGKEYIGISGIGISELGSHSAGKGRLADER